MISAVREYAQVHLQPVPGLCTPRQQALRSAQSRRERRVLQQRSIGEKSAHSRCVRAVDFALARPRLEPEPVRKRTLGTLCGANGAPLSGR